MSEPKTTRTVYIVQRIGWTFNDEWFYRDGMEDDKPVVAYASRAQAEAELLYFDREDRYARNPFLYGPDIAAVTHLTEDELVRLVESLGLPPPGMEHGSRDWQDWWEGIEADLTDEQREGIWGEMTKVKLHEIVSVEMSL